MNQIEAESFIRKDVSIECAKAYDTDSGNKDSLDALREQIDSLSKENKSHSLVLLVDDESYENKDFDFDSYSKWLQESGFKEAAIYRESQIKPICSEILSSIDKSQLHPNTASLLENENFPSQLYIATWFLLRLGYIKSPIFSENLISKSIFNILPESFKKGEEESIEIIKATPYVKAADQISYKFIPSN